MCQLLKKQKKVNKLYLILDWSSITKAQLLAGFMHQHSVIFLLSYENFKTLSLDLSTDKKHTKRWKLNRRATKSLRHPNKASGRWAFATLSSLSSDCASDFM